jgi:hypothetical protein
MNCGSDQINYMKEIETEKPELKTRRQLLAGIGIMSIFPLWKVNSFFGKKRQTISCAPPEEIKTMKVLSQDGKLLEVDISKIKSLKGKISDQELCEWIKK